MFLRKEKIYPIAKGAIKHIPGVKKILGNTTGGTINSRYCYSVWMRHLINLSGEMKEIPKIIAEIGPGDSLGIGLAALLSGSEKLFAFDVIKYWDTERNIKILDELIELFKKKSPIPDNSEFKNIKPELDNYEFPGHILNDFIIKRTLNGDRICQIKKELSSQYDGNNIYIHYQIPWFDSGVIKEESVDFIYSQAVLEHVEDLENTYTAMKKWLKPKAYMSHTIDFKSHGLTKTWNGHWTFNNLEWKLVKGGKVFLINRQPVSTHIHLHNINNFKIIKTKFYHKENILSKKEITKKFRNLSTEDLTTSGIYILSQKN